jgi:cytochrome c peroxidase
VQSPQSIKSKVISYSRTFANTVFSLAPILLLKDASRVLAAPLTDYSEVKAALKSLILSEPNFGPLIVRLAWHSSGTYDSISRTGGSSQGTIRFKEELSHGANKGLEKAVTFLEPIYSRFNSEGKGGLSYADLYTLAGVEAIKALGGPAVPWRGGRLDSLDPNDVTPDGRLPSADKGSPKDTC